MKIDWKNALRLEQAFFREIALQEERGFLVDWKLILDYIWDLTDKMAVIEEEVRPDLPLRCTPYPKKKKAADPEYPYLVKPFKKNGEASSYLEAWYETLPEDIRDSVEVGGPFTRLKYEPLDLDSNQQVKDYFLSVGWVPAEWNYNKETNKVTSPKMNKDDPFLGIEGEAGQKLAQRFIYKHRRAQLEGWLKVIRKDGTIPAEITGITPTARAKHAKVVNIPGGEGFDEDGNWLGAVYGYEMRSVFIPRKGYKIVGCDADSCQLRMLAHYMGDEAFTYAILHGKKEEGTDVHSLNTKLAGLTERRDGKTLIYATLFGAGIAKLAAQLKCTQKRARQIKKSLLKNLKAITVLIEGLKRTWKKRGYLMGLDGRKIYVRSEHMLLVYLLQAAEAILMKVATCYLMNWIRKEGLDAHLVAHMHDEFQLEVRDDPETLARVMELSRKSIVKAGEFLKLGLPMGGEAKCGMNWAETH
jgi:hypothetical protein